MTEQQVFATTVVAAGYVRCAADHPSFASPDAGDLYEPGAVCL